MDSLFPYCLLFNVFALIVIADPEFCTRGFQVASRFYKCWEQATFSNKYPPLHEPREYLDGKFVEAYASHMCSTVKPEALHCLKKSVSQCSNSKKLMDMADQSGGACEESHLNPFFKNHVIEHLVPIKGDSPCFELIDNTYECYKAAGDKVMQMGGQSDNIVTFHRVADKFFNAYWECMVEIYKSNKETCPHWQIPMLLTLQKTAMPSLFGLRLSPEQVEKLELGETDAVNETEGSNPGPSRLYLLLQLHQTIPDVSGHEDSLVIELADLNEEKPRMVVGPEGGVFTGGFGGDINPNAFTMKEIKNLMKEQRRRNREMKEFINQAKGLLKKRKRKGKADKRSKKRGGDQKKLSLDDMIA